MDKVSIGGVADEIVSAHTGTSVPIGSDGPDDGDVIGVVAVAVAVVVAVEEKEGGDEVDVVLNAFGGKNAPLVENCIPEAPEASGAEGIKMDGGLERAGDGVGCCCCCAKEDGVTCDVEVV